jgi:carboxypeptidase Taq
MYQPHDLFAQVCQHVKETTLLADAEALLGWDERTYLPPQAGEYRTEQLTLLSGMIHKRRTDHWLGESLTQLASETQSADPHDDHSTTIRQLKREYDKRVKLPQVLVEELSRTASLAQHAWEHARAKNDFAHFRPHLEKMFRLKREQAEAIGYQESPYDALLDDFEPYALSREINAVLNNLRDQLVPLVAAITSAKQQPDAALLKKSFPHAAQEKFGTDVAAAIGYSFGHGRLDVTSHPFCTSMGPSDCRITTRYDEHYLPSALFGILHEAGHGLYEQGLRGDWRGLPPGETISLGIHESQSRMWENLVGRSRSFWEHFYPAAQRVFASLAGVPLESFYFAINSVKPSLIRVEADEVTYNLHILIRFELEQALLSGDLKVADAPGAWNEKYQKYLGITPPNDADGVLQDIHWSAGLIGYFPTYTLGNLYAAQFFATADQELGGLDAQFRQGKFGPLREWLREKIHTVGQCYSAAELVQKVTGKPLSAKPLMDYLHARFGSLYGL